MNQNIDEYKLHNLSYLLRLWMVKSSDGIHWRGMLESPLTGERIGFPDLESLFNYIEAITQGSLDEIRFPLKEVEE